MFKKIFSALFFLSIFSFFFYLRLGPIAHKTVPYTYDQGRDFLKAEEIVRYKNPTFIGPTTGIMGVYHGPWWYYFLAVPYAISHGNPTGFLVFIFLSSLLQALLFALFIKKEFGLWFSLFFLSLVTLSPYFITLSFFAISSILTLPFILLLLWSTYNFLRKQSLFFIFLIFFSLGFIFEAEVPFGIFIIPSYLLTIFLAKKVTYFFYRKRGVLYALLGIFLPTIPRALFEVKHNFSQTRVLLNFLVHPLFHNPQPFANIIATRATLFTDFYLSLFPDKNIFLALVILTLTIAGFIVGIKQSQNSDLKKIAYLKFVAILFSLLFITSLFYKDNFWSNYYEGLPYFYTVFIVLGFYFLNKKFKKFSAVFLPIVITVLLLFALFDLYKSKNDINKVVGMRAQIAAVNSIYAHEKSDFCVRVYTPPVIPYTYNYLFDYYSQTKNLRSPTASFASNKCWYIMEREQVGEQFQARVVRWRKENIPAGSELIEKKKVNDDISIELWEMTQPKAP